MTNEERERAIGIVKGYKIKVADLRAAIDVMRECQHDDGEDKVLFHNLVAEVLCKGSDEDKWNVLKLLEDQAEKRKYEDWDI